MYNIKDAYKEVEVILNNLTEEEYKKIPLNVIEMIKTNKNDEYEYKLNNELELKYQPMLAETKAILFNLYRDYLASSEQKQEIIKIQNEERQKNELKKKAMYSEDVFINKQEKKINQTNDKSTQFTEYKEPIFRKIMKKIKSVFYNG